MNVSTHAIELLRRMRRDYEAARESGEATTEIVLQPDDYAVYRDYVQGFGAAANAPRAGYNPMSFNGALVISA